MDVKSIQIKLHKDIINLAKQQKQIIQKKINKSQLL